MADRLADSSPITFQKQLSEFIVKQINDNGMSDTRYPKAWTNKSNNQMLKAEIVLKVMWSEPNYYAILGTYLRMYCPLSSRHIYVLASLDNPRLIKKYLAYTLNLSRKLRTHPVFRVY